MPSSHIFFGYANYFFCKKVILKTLLNFHIALYYITCNYIKVFVKYFEMILYF